MATRGLGTKLKMGTTAVASLTEIGGLQLSADTIDVTSLDSNGGYREFIGGFKDGGEVPISGFFNPGTGNGQAELYEAFQSGEVKSFTIEFPASLGAEWQFDGVVTGFNTSTGIEDPITFEGTIKVSGKPNLGLTPSGGLTALSLTGAGGSLTPTFANGTYLYTFSGVTATSITVTATAADHTLKLYVDGVFTQNLTSGAASNAIAMAAVGSKKLAIFATEAGKTQKVYEIVAVKTA